jgi:hypothetical protein
MCRANRLGVAVAALEPHDFDVRMATQQPDELGAYEPGRTDDPHADPGAGARPAVRRDRSPGFGARAHGHVRPLTEGRVERVAGIGWTAVMTA